MSYEKMTFEKFLEKLEQKGYPSIAGARRAVGRSDWKQSQKDKAAAAINEFFGVSEDGTSTKPKTAAKPLKRPTSKVAAVSPKAEKVEKAAKPVKSTKAEKVEKAAAPVKRGPGRPRKETSATATAPKSVPYTDMSQFAQIQACRIVIEAASAALTALRGNNGASEDVQRAVDLTNAAVRKITTLAGNGQLLQEPEVTDAPAPEVVPEEQEEGATQQLTLFAPN